jgi:hypothetical protein
MGFFDELSGNAIAPITDKAFGRAGTRTAGNVDQLMNEDPMSRALFDQMQMERLVEETYKSDAKLVNQFSVDMLAIERAVEQIFKSGMAAGADAAELVATSFDTIHSIKMEQNYAAADLHTTDYKRQVTNLDAQRNATAGVGAAASVIVGGLGEVAGQPYKDQPLGDLGVSGRSQVHTDDPAVADFIGQLNKEKVYGKDESVPGQYEGLTRPGRSWDPDETLGGEGALGITTIGTFAGEDRGRPYMHTDEERAARSFPLSENTLGALPLARTVPDAGETHFRALRWGGAGGGASYALPVPSWFSVAENVGEE